MYGVGAYCWLDLGARLRSAVLRPKIQQQVHPANRHVNEAPGVATTQPFCSLVVCTLYRRAREPAWVQIAYGVPTAVAAARFVLHLRLDKKKSFRNPTRFSGPLGHPQGLNSPESSAGP